MYFGFGFDPIIHKGRLHLCDCWPFQPKMGISPMFGRVGITKPFVCYSHAASKADLPVHYQQLPMSAMIHPRQMVPTQGTVAFYLDSCCLHISEERLVNLATAHPIEEHMNFDPCC